MYVITSLVKALYVAFCKFASVLVAKTSPPFARLPNPWFCKMKAVGLREVAVREGGLRYRTAAE